MTTPFATGRCLCGAISYVARTKPIRMVQCHCRDCQRATGTGHISSALFKREEVAISGTPASFAVEADSGSTLTRHFCPACGGHVFITGSARPHLLSIMVGTADDNHWFTPDAVIYTKHRAPWDLTREDVPQYEGMPPAPPKKA